jgi:hypothetical protein
MLDAKDVEQAIAEEHRHRDSMNVIMGRMTTNNEDLGHAMDAMQDAGLSMMCSMHSHMHRQR